MVFRVFIFIYLLFFCLEPMARKDTWMRTTSVTVIVIYRKWHFESRLNAAIFEVPSQQFTRHLDNIISKDSL